MKRKDIDGSYVKRPGARYGSVRKRVDGPFEGYSSLICFREGTEKLIVNDGGAPLCLSDAGYRWLNYLPDNENWCVTAMYDVDGNIIEWYFDVTKSNFVDSEGTPCMDDLYLDIVLFPDGQVVILDEDELKEALAQGDIDEEDYRLAYCVRDRLLRSPFLDVGYLASFCDGLLASYV